LIEACEAIEWNELVLETPKSKNDTNNISDTEKGVMLRLALGILKRKIIVITKNIIVVDQLIVQEIL
jgi:hypothetical protein